MKIEYSEIYIAENHNGSMTCSLFSEIDLGFSLLKELPLYFGIQAEWNVLWSKAPMTSRVCD